MAEVFKAPINVDKVTKEVKPYQTTADVRQRWEVYKYDENFIDLTEEFFSILNLRGDELIVDVGCADAIELQRLRQKGHRGQLIGVDINNIFELGVNERMQEQALQPIDFRLGLAQDLKSLSKPIANSSIDVLTAFYSLYHVPNPEEAILEAKRALKDKGFFGVTTSGVNNKLYHRRFEKMIAGYLGIEPPQIFSSHFDDEKAKYLLSKHFDFVAHRTHQSWMVIGKDSVDGQSVKDYYYSLTSMVPSFNPQPRIGDFNRAYEEVVKPEIEWHIKNHGMFCDTIDRHLFICQKT